MLYFKDSATPTGIHGGFIEHDELEISDDELLKLKARARKAVTMDHANTRPIEPPREYTKGFLRQDEGIDHQDWLAGKRP